MGARRDVEGFGPACGESGDSSGLVGVGFVKVGEIGFLFMLGEAFGGFGDLGRGKAMFLAKACVDSVVCGEVFEVGFGVRVVK